MEPGVEEIIFVKPTQVGWSTALETMIGYWVSEDAGPILLVLDSQKTAQEVVEERIRPLISNTPVLEDRLSPHAHDNTLQSIKFDGCSLYLGWAGSAGTLARRAIQRVVIDEADKFPDNIGREADPISLAIERTATYGYRRKVLIGSTPTTRDGTIWKAYEAAGDKRKYFVPCPHCGEFQALVFGQIKYPELKIEDKNAYADQIEHHRLAHYECLHCRQPIREAERTRAILRGVWLSEGQSIDRAGNVAGNRPQAKRVAFWLNALYSPWRSFSAIAAEHRRSLNDPGRLQNFRNAWLAEPWEIVVKTANVDDYRKLRESAPAPGMVPAWAEYILAGADVQKDRCYWTVFAFGAEYRSQLVAYGLALTLDELKRHTLETQWQLETGGSSRAHGLFVDAGYRTDEVYQFARTDERIRPIKGDNDTQPMPVKYSTAGKHFGVPLYLLNTQLLKDRLSILRVDGRWQINQSVSDEFLQHLASEHKTLIKGKERWDTKSSGAANHYLDASVYALAGAEIFRVDLLTPKDETPAPPPKPQPMEFEIKRQQEQFSGRQTNNWLGTAGNWLHRN
jgi:phage terminase large subunit GpA-like protein